MPQYDFSSFLQDEEANVTEEEKTRGMLEALKLLGVSGSASVPGRAVASSGQESPLMRELRNAGRLVGGMADTTNRFVGSGSRELMDLGQEMVQGIAAQAAQPKPSFLDGIKQATRATTYGPLADFAQGTAGLLGRAEENIGEGEYGGALTDVMLAMLPFAGLRGGGGGARAAKGAPLGATDDAFRAASFGTDATAVAPRPLPSQGAGYARLGQAAPPADAALASALERLTGVKASAPAAAASAADDISGLDAFRRASVGRRRSLGQPSARGPKFDADAFTRLGTEAAPTDVAAESQLVAALEAALGREPAPVAPRPVPSHAPTTGLPPQASALALATEPNAAALQRALELSQRNRWGGWAMGQGAAEAAPPPLVAAGRAQAGAGDIMARLRAALTRQAEADAAAAAAKPAPPAPRVAKPKPPARAAKPDTPPAAPTPPADPPLPPPMDSPPRVTRAQRRAVAEGTADAETTAAVAQRGNRGSQGVRGQRKSETPAAAKPETPAAKPETPAAASDLLPEAVMQQQIDDMTARIRSISPNDASELTRNTLDTLSIGLKRVIKDDRYTTTIRAQASRLYNDVVKLRGETAAARQAVAKRISNRGGELPSDLAPPEAAPVIELIEQNAPKPKGRARSTNARRPPKPKGDGAVAKAGKEAKGAAKKEPEAFQLLDIDEQAAASKGKRKGKAKDEAPAAINNPTQGGRLVKKGGEVVAEADAEAVGPKKLPPLKPGERRILGDLHKYLKSKEALTAQEIKAAMGSSEAVGAIYRRLQALVERGAAIEQEGKKFIRSGEALK